MHARHESEKVRVYIRALEICSIMFPYLESVIIYSFTVICTVAFFLSELEDGL